MAAADDAPGATARRHDADRALDQLFAEQRRALPAGGGSTAAQLARALTELIISGALAPGAPLREVRLAAAAAVSRTTVREAIRVLTHEGLVRHEAHRGAVVAEPDAADLRDIFRVRRTLEVAGARAAAEAGPELRAVVAAALAAMERAADAADADALVRADLRLHKSLVALLASDRLSQWYETLQLQLRVWLALASREDAEHADPEPLLGEHRALCEALFAGRVETAEQLLSAHLDRSEGRLAEIAIARERR